MKTVLSRALSLLDGAALAAGRLDDPRDREALHDFRVSLRRLHAHLKSYRRVLDGAALGKPRRRLLKALAATSPARDAEVELAWLGAHAGAPASPRKEAFAWLAQELERRRREGLSRARGEGAGRFWRAEKKLRKALAKAVAPGARAALSAAAGPVIREAAGKLSMRFHGEGSVLDKRKIHKLRLSVKRLRYLIEPFKEGGKDWAAVLAELKRLQKNLGELHDGYVLAEELSAAAPRPARPGLSEAARELEAERGRLRRELAARWLGSKAAPLLRELDRLAVSLNRPSGAAGKGSAPKARSPRRPAAAPRSPAGTPRLSSVRS